MTNTRVSHKPLTALTGPNDDIVIPRMSWEKGGLDFESELVIPSCCVNSEWLTSLFQGHRHWEESSLCYEG